MCQPCSTVNTLHKKRIFLIPSSIMKVWVANTKSFIGNLVQHKIFGVPVFLTVLLVMFNLSFVVGAFFSKYLVILIDLLVAFLREVLPEGTLKSLIIDGIVNGVGEILLFVPNLVMLNLFISLMEDSGYMHRVVKLIDGFMHKLGLHGESLVSLVLGFSCNVPAILSTSKVENRGSRLIAMLIIPLMTCSARLPVFLAMSNIFFPEHAGMVLFSLYLLGVILALIVARILKIFLYEEKEVTTYSVLIPYKLPTLNEILRHIWEKTNEYIKSIFGVVLVASVLLWALSYYPHSSSENSSSYQIEQSYIGRIGKFVQPALNPLGFDWKTSVALLSGVTRKELVLSSIMVLYNNDATGEEQGLSNLPDRLTAPDPITNESPFTPLKAYVFLVFILLSFPCISTLITISRESDNWIWGVFALCYTTSLAWIVSFIVLKIGEVLLPYL